MNEKTREPAVSGIFYPEDPEKLRDLVLSLVNDSPVQPASSRGIPSRGIIVPHADFNFAGAVTASGFKSAQGRKITRAVLLGPIHRDPEEGIIFTESAFFHMPQGNLEVDAEIVDELSACSTAFIRNDVSHLEEHSIEVQLPFIQVLFPEAKIIPILVGKIDRKVAKSLANSLKLVFHDHMDTTLFVASSNMSCLGVEAESKMELDTLRRLILEGNAKGIYDGMTDQSINACGAACIALMLDLFGSGKRISMLGEGSSASSDGNNRGTVQYAAFGIS